jgi:hypothetical protein
VHCFTYFVKKLSDVKRKVERCAEIIKLLENIALGLKNLSNGNQDVSVKIEELKVF